jgi:hypothetical protein
MRCYICDYCDTTEPSLYNETLPSDYQGVIFLEDHLGREVCSNCYSESKDAIAEQREKLEFNEYKWFDDQTNKTRTRVAANDNNIIDVEFEDVA